MGLSKKHFKIAKILAATWMNSSTGEEKKKYALWERKNRRLAGEIFKPENYDEFASAMGRFDREEGWRVFEENRKTRVLPEGTRRKSVNGSRVIFTYAAVLVIFIACGVFLWLRDPLEKKREQPVFAYQIEAGTTGARLTLADGETLDIVKDQTFMARESDGTLIVTDSAGTECVVHDVDSGEEVRNTITTLTGMEYSLTLADGTRVYLNAESRLSFPVSFKGDRRRVELSGEAYFEVAGDSLRPFVITTRDLSVKVLGTSFNLRAYEDEKAVTTTLSEGKVQVFDGRQVKNIVSGEQVVYEKSTRSMTVNKEVEAGRHVAWREGKFVFRNERLEDMLKSLARWYDVRYRFENEELKDMRVGARLNRYSNMDPIIEMLNKNPRISITCKNKVLYISNN